MPLPRQNVTSPQSPRQVGRMTTKHRPHRHDAATTDRTGVDSIGQPANPNLTGPRGPSMPVAAFNGHLLTCKSGHHVSRPS